MITIKDVARHSGVSISTVSHVINSTRYVSKEVKEKVNFAIQELNYRPNALARGLKKDQTRTLGMMIPNSSNPFFAEVIRGVEDACFEQQYNVILCNSDDDHSKQAKYIQVLLEKRIDGLIIVSSGMDEHFIDVLKKQTIPISIIDREVEGVRADLIQGHHETGGYLAAKHLIELGHRKIACISGPSHLVPNDGRVNGYLKALKEEEIELSPELLIEGDFTSQGGHDAMKRLLDLEDRPTAIYICNDLMAIGGMSAAYVQEVKIPQELSVVGFDDIKLASFACPPLTTVSQPKYEMGKLTGKLILDHIRDKELQPQKLILEPKLVIRKSTAPPPDCEGQKKEKSA